MSWSLDDLHVSPRTEQRIGRAAWALAWFGLVAGQLHAMARHATPEGQGDFESAPLTKVWSVPLSDVLSPLLDWSDVYTVYRVYGLLWIPVYAAYTLCAFVVRSHRRPAGFERWGWRLLLASYVVMTLSIVGAYAGPWTDQSFAALGIPSAVLGLVGAPMLGISLVPRAPARARGGRAGVRAGQRTNFGVSGGSHHSPLLALTIPMMCSTTA